MSHSPINRRDALLAGAGQAISATAPSPAAAQTPQATTASTILKSQSLAPLMGAPVTLGKGAFTRAWCHQIQLMELGPPFGRADVVRRLVACWPKVQ